MTKNIIIAMTVGSLMTFANGMAVAQENKVPGEIKTDSSASYVEFKRVVDQNLTENKSKIADLKKRTKIETRDYRVKYDKKVLVVEEKNNELKKRIEESDKTLTNLWASFKSNFNRDMDQLSVSIKELTADNNN